MNELTKTVSVAKMTRWKVGPGFFRVAGDKDNTIRNFKELKVLALDDEPPVIAPLTEAQIKAGDEMLAELQERGDTLGFQLPTACVRFKRAILLTRETGMPKVRSYANGMTLYVTDPTLDDHVEVRTIPAVIVNAAFGEEDGVPAEDVELGEKDLMFSLLLASSVLADAVDDDDDNARTGTGRFKGVPVLGDKDKQPDAFAKVQCFIVEGDMAMLDKDEDAGETQVRVYGRAPIFVEPGATYEVVNLSDEERAMFRELTEGKFDFTKGLIFNGTSAMIEDMDGESGFAFGKLRGLCAAGTTVTRYEAWLPKDVVEAGGFQFTDEHPAPLPAELDGAKVQLEPAVTL